MYQSISIPKWFNYYIIDVVMCASVSNFNSKMVQLLLDDWELFYLFRVNFNSKMVQLLHKWRYPLLCTCIEFQFQNGSIITVSYTTSSVPPRLFQFQNGSIITKCIYCHMSNALISIPKWFNYYSVMWCNNQSW